MMIIDSQVHIWAPETPEKPYSTENAAKPHRSVPLGHDELLREMDGAGVARCVLVPPTWEADRNDTSLEAARLHPDRFAVMGKIKLTAPASRALMATWKSPPHMLGIRLVFNSGRSKEWLVDGTADWFWDAAERYDVPVMAFAPNAVPKLGAIAERHPGLRMVIDHLGLSSALRGKTLEPAVDEVIKLARLPNVAVKVSALPCYVEEPYPFPTLHPIVRRVVDAFGPRRCFWGTDLSHLTCPYKQCVTLFTEEMKSLSSAELEWIMGRGIAEWLNWPLPN
ncbi:MAG TPA: amidohydrolase family protein [Candidatus Binatia bacterium]|nr:amidohydrolase family protein [Candidatus Binatia bacterium]